MTQAHRYPAWCASCISRNGNPEMLTGFTLQGPCRKCGRTADLAIVKVAREEKEVQRAPDCRT